MVRLVQLRGLAKLSHSAPDARLELDVLTVWTAVTGSLVLLLLPCFGDEGHTLEEIEGFWHKSR